MRGGLSGGALLIAGLAPLDGGDLPVVTRLNNVKFRRMVRPGETLYIYVEFASRLSAAYFFKARTEVDGQTSCSLEFACVS